MPRFNADATRRIRRTVRRVEAMPHNDGAIPTAHSGRHVQWVSVINAAGEAIPPHAIMQVIGYDDTADRYEVDQVGSDLYEHGPPLLLVNGAQELAAGKPGFGALGGPITCKVAGTPDYGDTFGPADEQWELKAQHYGFKVLRSIESGLAVVLPYHVQHLRATLDEALPRDGTAPATIRGTDSMSDIGFAVDADGWFVPTDHELPADSRVRLGWDNGVWTATLSDECPEETE